jgi:hypothetical protein
MDLKDITKLNQMNSILNETMDRGLNKAIKVNYASRDFVLTNTDGSTTTVKMKDLVKKFQELSQTDSDGRNDSKLIDSIQEKLIRLDLRGDCELKKFGWISEKIRDLKNLFQPTHLKTMDAIEIPLSNKEQDAVKFLLDTFENNPAFENPKNPVEWNNLHSAIKQLSNNSQFSLTEDIQSALIHLLRTKPEVAKKAIRAFQLKNSPDVETSIILDKITKEVRVRYDRDAALKYLRTNLENQREKLLERLQEENFQDPLLVAKNYYSSAYYSPYDFRFNLSNRLDAIKDLVAEDPEKAFPLVNAIAKSNYECPDTIRHPNGNTFRLSSEDKKFITAHQDEYKRLLGLCEKYLLERDVFVPLTSTVNPDKSPIELNKSSSAKSIEKMKKGNFDVIENKSDSVLDIILKEANGNLLEEKKAIEWIIDNKDFSDAQIFEFFMKNEITKKPYYTGSYATNKEFRPFLISKIAQSFYRGERKDLVKQLGINLS